MLGKVTGRKVYCLAFECPVCLAMIQLKDEELAK